MGATTKAYSDRVVKIGWAVGACSAANGGFCISIRVLNRRCSWRYAAGVRSIRNPVAAIRQACTSVKQGGTLIEYTDEDPELAPIKRAEKSIEPDMNYAAATNDD
jgi:hypothetical protein